MANRSCGVAAATASRGNFVTSHDLQVTYWHSQVKDKSRHTHRAFTLGGCCPASLLQLSVQEQPGAPGTLQGPEQGLTLQHHTSQTEA